MVVIFLQQVCDNCLEIQHWKWWMAWWSCQFVHAHNYGQERKLKQPSCISVITWQCWQMNYFRDVCCNLLCPVTLSCACDKTSESWWFDENWWVQLCWNLTSIVPLTCLQSAAWYCVAVLIKKLLFSFLMRKERIFSPCFWKTWEFCTLPKN